MGHALKDTPRDYRSTLGQLHNPFYGETMSWDRFFHILRFLHFADNSHRPDEGEEYDWLWKLRTVFDKMNEDHAKFYNPSEHLAMDKNCKIQGQGYLQAVQSKENIWASKFTNSLMNQDIHDMRVYLVTLRHWRYDCNTPNVRHWTSRVEGLEHKIIMDNFFSSPGLFDDLDRHKISSCGLTWPNRKHMPLTLDQNNWNWKGVK